MKNILKRTFCIAAVITLSFTQLPALAMAEDSQLVEGNTLSGATATVNGKRYDVSTTVLKLNNAKIEDLETFKNELAGLPNLTRVELKGSNLTNDQMDVLIEAYPNIKFVWNIRLGNYWTIATDQVAFSCNKGGGPSLTNADVEQLKYCKDMVALDLGHNSFTDISFVTYMPNLRCIILSDGRVSDITPIRECKKLVYFEAWFCPISDLSPLQYLVNLKDVNVAHDRNCNNVEPLLHLPRLERIYMAYCNVPQSSIDLLRATFPNATIEMNEYYADRAGWRTHNRYYQMRRMYKTNTISDAYTDDYNSLLYFSKVFNAEYYAARYPEVVEKVGTNPEDLLYYFLNHGIDELQVAHPDFDVVEYAHSHPELMAKFGGYPRLYLNEYLYSNE